jgi:hypothetical protein
MWTMIIYIYIYGELVGGGACSADLCHTGSLDPGKAVDWSGLGVQYQKFLGLHF